MRQGLGPAAQRLRELAQPAPTAGMPAGLAVEVRAGLGELQAAAEAWLARQEQQRWRREQLLLCAEAAASRACSHLACTNCSGASESGLHGKRCSGCRVVRYCSAACQRSDWKAGHKVVCKELAAKQAAIAQLN